MKNKEIPELKFLLSKVEQTYGRTIHTSTNFEALSVVIEHEIHERISATTLKRLWGYVSYNSSPTIATLDVLARYVGEPDFLHFCASIRKSDSSESGFFSSVRIAASDLETGTMLRIGWNPNRIVIIEYLGECRFRVCKNYNSSLREGDEFEASAFMQGFPLYIPRLLRNGEFISYIAGSVNGLTTVETVKQD